MSIRFSRTLFTAYAILLFVSSAYSDENSYFIRFLPARGFSKDWKQSNGYHMTFDPQDILRCPLSSDRWEVTEIPAGAYRVYISAAQGNDAKEPAEIEFALGRNIVGLMLDKKGSPRWYGPVHCILDAPKSTIEVRGEGQALIRAFYIVPEGSPTPQELEQAAPIRSSKDWQTVWVDLPQSTEIPAWYPPGHPIALDVRSRASSSAGKATVRCRILNFDHKLVREHTFSLPLEPSLSDRLETLPVPEKYGPYLLRCSVTLPNGQTREFQRIVARISEPMSHLSSRLGGHGNFTLLPMLGAGWNRQYDSGGRGLLWKNVQPEKDKPMVWNVRLAPRPLKRIVVLESTPKWAPIRYDDPKPFLHYVRAVAERYKGQIDVYEICNEPYKKPTEEFCRKHVSLVNRAAVVIRQIDPNAKIATGGPPEEMPPGLTWWRKMAQRGLFENVDIATAHLYVGGGGTHPLDQDLAFDAYVTSLRKLLDELGEKGKPIWDTESGLCPNESFYIGRLATYGLWSPRGFVPRPPVPYKTGAAMTGRLLLLHLWHDIPWMLYHTCTAYGSSWALCDRDGTPMPSTVSMAQLIRFFDEAKPEKRPPLPEGLFGVRFRKGRDIIDAVWAVDLQPGEKRYFSLPSGVKALDMFGNPMEQDVVEIGMAPILFVGPVAWDTVKIKRKIDPAAAPPKMTIRLTSPGADPSAKLLASSTARGYGLDPVRNGSDVGSGSPQDSWSSPADGKEHWIEYRWNQPQTIHRILCAWPPGDLPQGYLVEWHNGVKWRTCSATPTFVKVVQRIDDYPVKEIVTKRLRMRIRTAKGRPAKVTAFDAYRVPRVTPPLREMQEIWGNDFSPSPEGFMKDWLLCGPFPSPGNRYDLQKERHRRQYDVDLLKQHWRYGRRGGEKVITPKVDQEHHARFPARQGVPWKPMDVRVAWQPWHAGDDGFVNLGKAFTNDLLVEQGQNVEQSFGYALCYLDIPREITGTLCIGSDDGYRIWIDDQVFAHKEAYRQAKPDQESYPIRLARGLHRVLVKVHNDIGSHSFYLRFKDSEGNPITNYTIQLLPGKAANPFTFSRARPQEGSGYSAAPTSKSRSAAPLFSFMQFSDVHVGNRVNRPVHKRLQAAVKLANAKKISFVIDTGDITNNPVYGPKPEYLAELDEYLKYVNKLKVPIYIVPGNHDIGYSNPVGTRSNGQPWGEYKALVKAYREKIGPLDQSFTYKGFQFLLVNNNPKTSGGPGYLSDKQLAWIEKILQKGRPTLLFCHVQVLFNGVGEPWGDSSKALVNLCRKYGVISVAYGHKHEMHVKILDGTLYIMCPDLKVSKHRDILEYQVYDDHIVIWKVNVFTGDKEQLVTHRFVLKDISATSNLSSPKPPPVK